jgi:hypothetical protein
MHLCFRVGHLDASLLYFLDCPMMFVPEMVDLSPELEWMF